MPIKYLQPGEYLTKNDLAYYRISFDFHNCTYTLFDLTNQNRTSYFLSEEEVYETAERGGYHILKIKDY